MAARTDRQVDQSIAASAAALGLPTSALAPTQLPWAVGTTPVPAGTFTMLDTANATGKQTILNSTVPAYGPNLAGPTASGTPLANPTYVAKPSNTVTNVYDASGNVIGTNTVTYNWDGTPNAPVYTAGAPTTTASTSNADAFANLTMLLNEYGLGSLSDTVTRMIKMGLTPQEALAKLKYDKTIDPVTGKAFNDAYTTRFAGNTARVNAGLNAISEAAYINLENSYAETLKSYGLGNMLSTDRVANEKMFSKYIAQDISALEFTDRIKLAEDTVINADPAVLKTFNNFYGTLTNADLISYVLAPDETLPKLQTKAAAAQIGSAAVGEGLPTNVASAEALALQGVTYNQAQLGYAKIGQELPIASKLSSIYNGQIQGSYDQAAAEAEQFSTTGAASAARKKQQLKELETQQFAGRSGVLGANVSSGYSGSLGKGIQGSF
jgi:hypothetical protein